MLLPRVGVFTLKVLPLLVAVSVTAYADTAISTTEIAIAATPKTVGFRIIPPRAGRRKNPTLQDRPEQVHPEAASLADTAVGSDVAGELGFAFWVRRPASS